MFISLLIIITTDLNMTKIIKEFESELINKLQYKASCKTSLDSFLLKCFKFFDLYNNGHLNKNQFFKAIAKCGMVVESYQMDSIFEYYDTKKCGKIFYKDFIEQLLFKDEQDCYSKMSKDESKSHASRKSNEESRMETSKLKQQTSPLNEAMRQSKIDTIYKQCETYEQIKNTITKKITQQGITGLLQLANRLKARDVNRCHIILDRQLLAELSYLTAENIKTIIMEFDHNNSHQINYAELIYSLRGPSQQAKQSLISQAFNFLDTKAEKQFKVQDLLAKFKNRKKYPEFKKAVELYCSFQGIDDGFFTDEDFSDFFDFIAFGLHSYEMLSSYIQKGFFQDEEVQSNYSQQSRRSREFSIQQRQNDIKNRSNKQSEYNNENIERNFKKQKHQQQPHFKVQQQMQTKQYNHYQKSVSRYSNLEKKSNTSTFVRQVEQIIVRIKKRLASKGTKGFLLFEKALKNVDTDEDTLINYDEFRKVVTDQRIDITTTQSNLVFDVFDQQGTGFINYVELVYTLKGSTPEHRKLYMPKLWQKVRVDDHSTSFPAIKQALSFRGHPDIQSGRKYQQDILKQVQDTILLIQDFNQRPRSEKITKQQFEEYFQHLSLSTIDDQLFESILMNFWRVTTNANIKDKYAGSRKMFDPNNNGYLMDHHRYAVKGGSVSQNAPFGTFQEPTNYLTEHHRL